MTIRWGELTIQKRSWFLQTKGVLVSQNSWTIIVHEVKRLGNQIRRVANQKTKREICLMSYYTSQ